MSQKELGSPGHLPDPATWVDQYGDYLFRFALARLGNAEVAEDLVQETFLAALRAREQFAGRSADRSWFVGILKHKMVDHLRKKAHEQPPTNLNSVEGGIDDLFDHGGRWRVPPSRWADSPREVLEKREFWEVFRRCLANLPQRLAAVFSLREVDEVGTDEICEALHVTPGHLGVLLYRARMRLRRCLETNWFGAKTEEV